MGIVLDLIIIAIILIFCLISAKKGFVKTVVEAVGIVAAIILSFTVSSPLAGTTYDKIIEPPILSAVSVETTESSQTAVQNMWDSMPKFIVKNADRLSLNSESITQSFGEDISQGVETAVKSASQNVVKPIAVKILGIIYSVIIFVVLWVIFRFLAKIINKLFSFSLVGKANRILGGIVGILKGTVIALVFSLVISVIVSFTQNGFLIFTPQNIDSSYIFKLLTEIAPF